jgi:BirA family biotin operon repressor/biotin-[acetyl-CoA-carboxylase] ligase
MQVGYEALKILSDGKFHSGTALAQALKVSRSSIWKGIAYLRELGVAIDAVSGRGYRWSVPMELLNKKSILALLSPQAQSLLPQMDVVNVVTSTNDYLHQRLGFGIPSGSVCIAEAQTAGKGRMGKRWQSPFGTNIYFSFYWRFPCKVNELSGLSLVIGLAIIEALKQLAPLPQGLGVKWPNDIWFNEAKLCGILLETATSNAKSQTSSYTDVVIGIGLNVNMSKEQEAPAVWTDLNQVFGFIPSRNRVIANILNVLILMLKQFQDDGFSSFIPLWEKYDLLIGKEIQLTSMQSTQAGVAQGVNERGELCVQIGSILKAIRYGDVSVRLK